MTEASHLTPAAPNSTHLTVDAGHSGRLDKFLAKKLNGEFSRERLKQLITDGHVTVNQKTVTKASFSLAESDNVSVNLPENEALNIEAEDIPLDVIYEDNDLLVIVKPSGMLTHPTGSQQSGTLVNALLHYCTGSLSGINGTERPGIVHRLDRQTSGLLMVAKNDKAHRGLAQQLEDRTASREYLAIAQGEITEETGTISAGISRHPKVRNKMRIDPDGRRAVTHWQVVERLNRFTLVRLKLETGRTHQIRLHLAHIKHPILGDPQYGSGMINLMQLPPPLRDYGQFLQAVALKFEHPISGQSMSFSQPLSSEFESMLDLLRKD